VACELPQENQSLAISGLFVEGFWSIGLIENLLRED
jgi:hypothetical protein